MNGTSGFKKNSRNFEKQVLPQAARLSRTSDSLKKSRIFEKKFCPRQRSCPGQVACSKKVEILRKVLPQAAKLPGTNGLFKEVRFLRRKKVLPQAAKLPGTSGLLKKSPISEIKFCLRQRSYPGQVARPRESEQPLQPRARSAFWGVQGPLYYNKCCIKYRSDTIAC